METESSAQSIYNFISDHFVLIHPDQSFEQASASLLEKKGAPDWALLIRSDDGSLRGCSFNEIRQWRIQHGGEKVNLSKMLQDPRSPLLPVEVLDENAVDMEMLQQKSTNHPCGLLAFSYFGEIVGVYAPETSPSSAAEPAPAVAAPHPIQHQPGGFRGGWDGFIRSWRDFYHKWRLGIILAVIVAIINLIVQYVIPLAGTNLSELFPSLFPATMTGEWNIVVSGFQPVGKEAISSKTARRISEVFYNHFSGEVSALGDELGVAVQILGPSQSPNIRGQIAEQREQQAAKMADRMKADVIIYGTIENAGDAYLLKPEFFVNTRNFQEAEEIVGQHQLGSDIRILGDEEQNPTQITLNRELSHRSQVLALISKGLAMLFTHQYEDALAMFQAANADQLWEFNAGREVVYLFEGNAAGKADLLPQAEQAFQDALRIDPEYARAYAGLGSVYYTYSLQGLSSQNFNPNREDLQKALEYFQFAEQASHKPVTANIPAKIAFGRGQVYMALWLVKEAPAEQAVEQFQFVIDQYQTNKNEAIREIASESCARLGLIARQSGDTAGALERYTQAAGLATNPARRAVYQTSIGDLCQGQDDEKASAAYQKAIQEYQSAMRLTTQLERRADYWVSIAGCYLKLNQQAQALDALQQALDLLPADSTQRSQVEAQIQQLAP
jgi:tetratricopeptide (TPR) repeat protein